MVCYNINILHYNNYHMSHKPIKILVIGDSMVGKTSYAKKLSNDQFEPYNSKPTIGNTILKHKYTDTKNGDIYDVMIWDTTGQEKFRSMMPSYYREADGAFCMFSMDDLQSFYHVSYWINEFKYYCPEKPFLVAGTKYDLKNHVVSKKDIKNLKQ